MLLTDKIAIWNSVKPIWNTWLNLFYNYLKLNKTLSKISLIKNPFGSGIQVRSYSSWGYRFGFNGKERDDEINEDGGSYDFGSRIYDGRLGRWLSLDPQAIQFPNLSPYCSFGSNPIFYIDPDGEILRISTTVKRSERKAIMRNLRKLTDDKLSYNKKTGEVTIKKKRNGSHEKGTALVNNIITDEHTTIITTYSGGDNRTLPDDKDKASNKEGSDATILLDLSSNPKIPTEDPKTGNVSEKQFQRKHDTIFFYSKSDSWKFHPQEIKEYYASIYGPQFKPSFKGRKSGKDEYGEFRISFIDDVWNLSAVFTLSNEHTGYPTQKPEKLLERIIKASSNNNDLVADFYMGSGTTAVVCKELNRNFIGCDINEMAINIAKSRFDKKFFKQKNINDFMETIK